MEENEYLFDGIMTWIFEIVLPRGHASREHNSSVLSQVYLRQFGCGRVWALPRGLSATTRKIRAWALYIRPKKKLYLVAPHSPWRPTLFVIMLLRAKAPGNYPLSAPQTCNYPGERMGCNHQQTKTLGWRSDNFRAGLWKDGFCAIQQHNEKHEIQLTQTT